MSTPKTPLRYPGGKHKVWQFIAETIYANNLEGGHYVEPYAGGAGVAIELLLGEVVSSVHLNDSCPAVFAFWHTVINEPEELCRKISKAPLTIEEWEKQKKVYKNPSDYDRIDLGFAMFYLNRCNRSGILSGGVIGGKKQDGFWKMDARFAKGNLVKRVEKIAKKGSSIKIKNWDAEKYILQYVSGLPENKLVYCDPPYFSKADRLYANYYNLDDHVRLSETIQRSLSNWIVSYDDADLIMALYKDRQKFTYSLQYNAASAYKGTEVFIFCDSIFMPSRSEIYSIDNALKNMRLSFDIRMQPWSFFV
ncbi:MAG: DNA adenine methylase [Deltaproteobacteria bacterium]|nr:DNA adenine methylase [Deltaproteobacteria bacterium]